LAVAFAPVLRRATKTAKADAKAGRPGVSLEIINAVSAAVSATVAARAAGRAKKMGGIPELRNHIRRLVPTQLPAVWSSDGESVFASAVIRANAVALTNDAGRAALHTERFLNHCLRVAYEFEAGAPKRTAGRPGLEDGAMTRATPEKPRASAVTVSLIEAVLEKSRGRPNAMAARMKRGQSEETARRGIQRSIERFKQVKQRGGVDTGRTRSAKA
jgi:hypothetical protein